MKRVLVTVVVMWLAAAPPAVAQAPQTYHDMWTKRVATIARLRSEAPLNMVQEIGRTVDVFSNPTPFLLFAHAANMTREFRLIEDARTDKQLGSPAGTTGSTSLVSRGAVPGILAFAVENGALSQTADATSVTLRGNAVGWLDLLQGQDFIASYDDDSRLARALRAVSYSFTFNTTSPEPAATGERPDADTVVAQSKASGRQLAALSARVALVDQRDPRRPANRAAVGRLMDVQGVALLTAPAAFDDFFNAPDYSRWLEDTKVALSAPGRMATRDIERVVYRQLEALRHLMAANVPDFEGAVTRFVNALEGFESARDGAFKAMSQRFVLAAEFVRSRPALAPASSTYRLIADGRPGDTRLDLTANVAITYQDDEIAMVPAPRATGGLRDIQFAVQAELPYGKQAPSAVKAGGIGRPVVTLEYLSRKLFEKAVVNFGGHDFSVEPGWIHVAQAKVTIPVKGSGVKVPFSVSIANRTELIREKSIRAHLGVTFDMDVLAAAVRR